MNAGHRILWKRLALTPVKFGISFTTTHLNQAGALVLVHADGSIHLPTTSATAASSGADLNGMAAKNAAETIRAGLDTFATQEGSGDWTFAEPARSTSQPPRCPADRAP